MTLGGVALLHDSHLSMLEHLDGSYIAGMRLRPGESEYSIGRSWRASRRMLFSFGPKPAARPALSSSTSLGSPLRRSKHSCSFGSDPAPG